MLLFRLFLLSLIFFSFMIVSHAQNVKKAFDYLNEKKFDKAVEICEKSITDKKYMVEAKYCLAKIYSDKSFKKYNILKAYKNIRYAEIRFPKLTPKEKNELQSIYSINNKSIDELKNSISATAFELIKDKGSIDELNSFIGSYDGALQIDDAKSIRNKKAFQEAKIQNTYKAYKLYFDNYPDAPQAAEAKAKCRELYNAIYEKYAMDGEISSLELFASNYPDYPFYDSISVKNKELAAFIPKLRITYGYQKDYEEYYIKYIKEAAPRELAFVVLQLLLRPVIEKKNWTAAIDLVKKYQPYFKKEDKRFQNLINIFSAKDNPVDVKSIGRKINTKANEYAPLISADGKTLYFCGRDRTDNLGLEDIFISQWANNEWDTPHLLNGINTAYNHEAPLAISADANRLLAYSNSDIYFSDKQVDGWAPLTQFPKVNKPDSWEADAMMTADGKAILFISDRKGNTGIYHKFSEEFHGNLHGNLDIYVSLKTDAGWSDPINLGQTINTPFSERSPFLHPDMKTLYFSSDGHGGMGKMDVFKCTRLSDTSWTQWSEPVNLGKEINSPDDEYDYKINTDGTQAYFSVQQKNNIDIVYIDLPQEYRPEAIATIRGIVTDKKTKKPITGSIKWENLTTGKQVGLLKSDPVNGSYIILLPMGKLYGYYVEKENYYPVSGNIDLRNQNKKIEIEKNFELVSIDQIINNEVPITLQNVFFDYDRYELKPESWPELNRFADFLVKYSNLKIEISGHTDNTGGLDHNQTLSENRAKSVRDYLITKGCKPDLLVAVGYGQNKPIEDNTTETGKAHNRRVEFKVVK